MNQYNNIQQLLKKEAGQKDRLPVFPPTVIQAVFDGNTGANLEAILAQFNSIHVQYQGSPKDTRNIIPEPMRRPGLIITYMDMDSKTITEKANSAAQKDNDHWGLDTNWSRVDELTLSGDISVSAAGTWIINGQDTHIKAVGPKGDAGLTPWLKTIDNHLHFSYDGITWEPCSEPIAAWFRWSDNKIQISRDNKTWTDLTGKFADNLFIKAYVATTSELPSGAAQGNIYGVGPTYAAEDTGHKNPIYRYYVRNAGTWVDNGSFISISAGVVQETGDSETEVMSQKAVTTKLAELGSKANDLENKKATKAELQAEVTRATNAELALRNSINTEVLRAKEAEEELDNRINANRYGYNVTVNGLKGGIHTIETAIKDVPSKFRMLGQKITFRTENGDWATYHNESLSLDNYDNVNDWVQEVGISSVQGDVNITNVPDYEDLTEAADGIIKFADKEYSAESFSGLGRVYLRKNIVDGVNVLTQDMMTKANTIYIVQYDYDLQGAEITIPEGCVLDFQGGSFNNGLINSNGVHINGYCNLSLFLGSFNLLKKGLPSKVIPISYYKNGTDAERLQTALDVAKSRGYSVQIDETLEIDKPIYIEGHIRVFGDSWRSAKIRLTTKEASIVLGWKPDSGKYNTNVYEIDIDNITISGNDIADYCIIMNHATQCRFNLVYAGYATTANFRIYKSSINWYDRCYSYYAPCAFEFEWCGNNSISALNAWENNGLCNFIGEVGQLNFDRCWFERNPKFFDLQDTAKVRVNIINCYILNSSTNLFHFYEGNADRTASLNLCISQTNMHIPLGSDSYLIKTSVKDTVRMYVDTTQLYCPSLVNIINNDASPSKDKVTLKYDYSNTGALPTDLLSNGKGGIVLGFRKINNTEYGMDYSFALPLEFANTIANSREGSIRYDVYNKTIMINVGGKEVGLGYKKTITSGEPTSPTTGQVYFNTSLKKDLLYNGTSWVNVDGTVNISSAGYLSDKPEKASNGQMYFASAEAELFPIYATYISNGVVGRWVNSQGISMKGVTHLRGSSAIRESMALSVENRGLQYYDTDLRQPLWYNGYGDWLTAEKNKAGQTTSGTFDTKPSSPKVGFGYFCTDRKTTEGTVNGIMIYYKGNNVWVDALGRVVE